MKTYLCIVFLTHKNDKHMSTNVHEVVFRYLAQERNTTTGFDLFIPLRLYKPKKSHFNNNTTKFYLICLILLTVNVRKIR